MGTHGQCHGNADRADGHQADLLLQRNSAAVKAQWSQRRRAEGLAVAIFERHRQLRRWGQTPALNASKVGGDRVLYFASVDGSRSGRDIDILCQRAGAA